MGRVGLVRFSNIGESRFFLDTYSTKQEIRSAILSLPYVGGNTNTSGGLRELTNNQFSSAHGDREDVPNVAIVLTDGISTRDNDRTIADAEAARRDGIDIISIGITTDADEKELREMSSEPQIEGKNYFKTASFQVLDEITSTILEETCSLLVSENLFCEHSALGGYQCFCKHHLCDVRPTNGTKCTDVDECSVRNGGCQHECTNTEGSFVCSCRDGYNLNTNTRSCDDVDECAADSNPCAAGELCANTHGGYYCLNINGVAGLIGESTDLNTSMDFGYGTVLLAALIAGLVAIIGAVIIIKLVDNRRSKSEDLDPCVGMDNFYFASNENTPHKMYDDNTASVGMNL